MSLFSRLFGFNKKSNDENDSELANSNSSLDENFEDIFIDNQQPLFEEDEEFNRSNSVEEPIADSKQRLQKFLQKDYMSIGYESGYNFHNPEHREIMLSTIVSEFQEIMDSNIFSTRQEIQSFSIDKVDCKGEDLKSLKEKVEIVLLEMDEKLRKFINEKDLSSLRQGWIQKCLNSFNQGYLEGMERYLQAKMNFTDLPF